MKLIKCFMNQSTWLKANPKKIKVKGVLWHSTGANNNTLKRYVQPDDNAKNKKELLNSIGVNQYGNDWNHIEIEAGLSFWIGKLADGSIATIQAGPDDITQWGCGGSLNNTHIQFEICEDGLNDEKYFKAVYKEAIELTAYLCKKYNLNPLGFFTYNKKKVPVITDHAGSYELGMGSNHGDVGHWFRKYIGDNYIETIRKDVAKEMKEDCEEMGCQYWKNGKCTKDEKKETSLKLLDRVKLTEDATVYGKTQRYSSWVYAQKLYVREIEGDRIVVSTLKEGAITGAVHRKHLKKV